MDDRSHRRRRPHSVGHARSGADRREQTDHRRLSLRQPLGQGRGHAPRRWPHGPQHGRRHERVGPSRSADPRRGRNRRQRQMTALAAIGLGILIGLSLGALGGGGSILTVPALVYALGQSTGAATTESLVIVGITSTVAAVGHARARHVRSGAGTAFGLAGVASSYAGTALNPHANPDALLLAFV